jgi:hypothetical protein
MISRGRAAKESTTVDLMAVQTCAALRKFDARSETVSSKIRPFGRHQEEAGIRPRGFAKPDGPLVFIK